MKTKEEMKNVARCIWGQFTPDGMSGEIQMIKWRGSIIVSWGAGWEHVSVSPYNHRCIPSWEDMCYIKNLFWNEDESVVQYHPAASEYVNQMPNCLHLWKPVYEKMPCPPTIMTGVKKGQSRQSVQEEIRKLYPLKAAAKEIDSMEYPEEEVASALDKDCITDRYQAALVGWKAAARKAIQVLYNHSDYKE